MSKSISDRNAVSGSGYAVLLLALAIGAAGLYAAGSEISASFGSYSYEVSHLKMWTGILSIVAALVLLIGIYQLEPNESAVMTLFGEYAGTDSETGLRWTNPLNAITKISLRLQNHNIVAIKVNDASGNPIEIGAAIVWHVRDSAKATFEVDSYHSYVELQSETALRSIASSHPYDHWHDKDSKDEKDPSADDRKHGGISLRDSGDEVTEELKNELRKRLEQAGLAVIDARITHLAYSAEIAPAMLKRQQAAAVISARKMIVRGAVGLVKDALDGLKENGVVIDPERQAAMASNLLVVLVSDKDASPVINTGTLHG